MRELRPEAVTLVGVEVFRDPKGAHPTTAPPVVGGRLKYFQEQWYSIDPDSWVSDLIQFGYKIEFTSPPPRKGLMKVTPVPRCPDQRSILENEILGLLQKEAIVVVPSYQSRLLYRSSFFLAPKKPHSWRPILNLKPLNKKFIRPQKFRMETLASIIPTCCQGMWASTIDLKDAYLHIPIHPQFQHFLAFRYKHVDYKFQALPFGLSTAPRVFTRVSRAVLAFLRRNGITLFAYIDDWLILGESQQECLERTSFVIHVLQNLGWIINLDKSNLQPSQSVIYLGAHLDFVRGCARPTPERVTAISLAANRLLARRSHLARFWLRFLGLAASLVEILPYCRLYMRPIQFHLLRHFSPSRDPLSLSVPLSQDLVPFLKWWTLHTNLSKGRPFVDDKPSALVTTDASNDGWGATWGSKSTSGLWSFQERSLHINALELLAVRRAILTWANDLKGHNVTVLSDNSTTVSYLNRHGGTRSFNLCLQTWEFLHICQSLNISIKATHLPGEQNVMADALSRGLFNQNEWSLSQSWADHLFQIFGRPHVDLFASHLNFKLPTFVSRNPHPLAWATDALSLDWNHLMVYAFPPIPLLQRVLLKLRRSSTEMILVAPFWPRQSWFPLILHMLVDLPFLFPEDPQLLSQVRQRIRHPDLQSLHLAAWKLSTNVLSQRAFHNELRNSPPIQEGNPPLRLTIQDWRSSTPGQKITLSIPWRPQ